MILDSPRDVGVSANPRTMLGILAFGWVMLDALINYFIKTLTGHLPPINAILPLVLIAILFKWGWNAIWPPTSIAVALAISVFGFLLGPLLVPEIGLYRLVELIGALSAFAIGYFSLRWSNDERPFIRIFLTVCALYVVVCVIALWKIAPGLFPIVNSPWAFKNTIVLRPEVMTDQNFQIFYVLSAALVLCLPYRLLRFWFALALTLGGLYVLAKLQTRSGTLILAAVVVLAICAPIWNRALGRGKLILLPLFLLILAVIGVHRITEEGGQLIARFTETDYQTGYSRLESFLYLFENIYNPLWWLPQGNAEFLHLHHTIPHSTPTAMFLEGGLPGIYMWVAVFLLPAIGLTRMLMRGELDPLATMIWIGGLGILLAQLTLNVPFFKQPWLWAGAVVGTWYRMKESVAIASAPAFDSKNSSRLAGGVPAARLR